MLKLLRSGNDGALLQARAAQERACQEDQRYLQFQPGLGEYYQGVRLWEWCPRPLLDSHDHVC